MFGLDAVWTVILIASITNFLFDVVGEVFFEGIAHYLKDYFTGGTAAVKASCVAFGVPASIAEALEAARTVTHENIECMREYLNQKNAGGGL